MKTTARFSKLRPTTGLRTFGIYELKSGTFTKVRCRSLKRGATSLPRPKRKNSWSRVMAKKLTRIEREIRDHPEKFDFGDIPPARKKIPAQEARYDEMRPQWAKDLAGDS